MSALTELGFTFGAAEVARLAELPDGRVCISVATAAGCSLELYVSPKGHNIRVFEGGKERWRAEPASR